jgi:hypothetical protein
MMGNEGYAELARHCDGRMSAIALTRERTEKA